ncbi:MAG: acyl carrier protein [Waddliaceae bacterium]
MTIQDKVVEIIVEQLGTEREQVKPEKSFVEDFNADSLDIMELVMTFEENFGIEIPEGEAEKMKTVGDVITYIETHVKE